MKRFLLDTNIASYLIKRTFPGLTERVRHMPKGSYAISSISEAEMRLGAARKPTEAKIHPLVAEFLNEIEIEPWDSKCAKIYARLVVELERKGEPLSNFDAMIAAHALAHDFVLVTHDYAFPRVAELKVEDWTKGPHRL
jgi:tRNA(fMet)-specific endonuclease VapC